MGICTLCSDRVRMAIHFFVNIDVYKYGCISVKTSQINTNRRDSVNLGVPFLTLLLMHIYHECFSSLRYRGKVSWRGSVCL